MVTNWCAQKKALFIFPPSIYTQLIVVTAYLRHVLWRQSTGRRLGCAEARRKLAGVGVARVGASCVAVGRDVGCAVLRERSRRKGKSQQAENSRADFH